MIEVENCYGCGACCSICPQKAISMERNQEGFYIPVVDLGKCIMCGKCLQVCPMEKCYLNSSSPITCYGIYNKNEDIRKNSSSGGVFSLLAEEVLNEGGYVCGVSYDPENGCHHIVVNNSNDLSKLRGSKYIQSNVGNTYEQTKKILDEGKWVLYSGTPCQIAGLKNFLGKDYERLLTIDLICHGAPSPKVWEEYLKDNFQNENIKSVNFRDKSTGWKEYSVSINTNKRCASKKFSADNFMKGFLKNVYLNENCYSCPFHSMQRPADITLGDFWGYNVVEPELDDDKGMGIIFLNSMKGEVFFNNIKTDLYYAKKYPLGNILPYNPSLCYPSPGYYSKKLFFYLMNKEGFNAAFKRLTNIKKNVAIFNLWHTRNYGAILTAYALQTVLLNLGYNPCLIKNTYKNSPQDSFNLFYQFEQENLFTSKDIYHPNMLKNLNNFYDNFIVGSDQVWRFEYTGHDYKTYFLSFIAQNKKKIACAASFGQNYWEGPKEITKEISSYLKGFNAISTREKSGVNICKNIFKVTAKAVFDPVFLLNKKEWEKLLEKSSIDLSEFCIIYALDYTTEIQQKINLILSKISIPSLYIESSMNVYDFLRSIKTAKKVVTDSFHGVCFSIIFRRDFICLCNKNRGEDRFLSLLSDLGLMDRLFYNLDEVDWNKLAPIDYQKVDLIIEQKRQEGIVFLTTTLER